MFIVFIAIVLILSACTPMTQQQRPIEEQQQGRQQDKPLETKGDLQTNQSAIYDPGEVRNCRVTADTLNVKAGTGNNFNTVGNLSKNDVVKVLRQVGGWYVIQMDNNQIGAIDSENATPVVKESDVPRVPQVQQPQQAQQPQQQDQAQQPEAQQPQAQQPKAQPQQAQQPQAQQPQAQQPQQQQTPAPQTTNKLSAQEQQMVNLVNQERTKNGLNALIVDLEVARVAGVKSQDMADNNYFSHNSPTYGSPFDMMKKFGINYLHAGENLAGNASVEKAHTALMNSAGHKQNILSPNFTHIGVGVRTSSKYGYLYTQMFISKPK